MAGQQHRRRGGKGPDGRVDYGWGVPVRGMYDYSLDYGSMGAPETDSESIPGYETPPPDWTGPAPRYESQHWAAREPAFERRYHPFDEELARSGREYRGRSPGSGGRGDTRPGAPRTRPAGSGGRGGSQRGEGPGRSWSRSRPQGTDYGAMHRAEAPYGSWYGREHEHPYSRDHERSSRARRDRELGREEERQTVARRRGYGWEYDRAGGAGDQDDPRGGAMRGRVYGWGPERAGGRGYAREFERFGGAREVFERSRGAHSHRYEGDFEPARGGWGPGYARERGRGGGRDPRDEWAGSGRDPRDQWASSGRGYARDFEGAGAPRGQRSRRDFEGAVRGEQWGRGASGRAMGRPGSDFDYDRQYDRVFRSTGPGPRPRGIDDRLDLGMYGRRRAPRGSQPGRGRDAPWPFGPWQAESSASGRRAERYGRGRGGVAPVDD